MASELSTPWACSSDDRWIAVICAAGEILIIDAKTGQLIRQLDHGAKLRCVALGHRSAFEVRLSEEVGQTRADSALGGFAAVSSRRGDRREFRGILSRVD